MPRSSKLSLLKLAPLLLLAFVGPDRMVSSQGVATRSATPLPRPSSSGRPFPVSFVDISREAGLLMTVRCGSDESKKFIIEANGTGVALVDYDNDGWLDIFAVNSSQLEGFKEGAAPRNHLYRNNRDGTFTDISEQAGLAWSGWGNGVCTGDYDNDGFIDLFVAYWGPNVLYKNSGNSRFEDVTSRAGVAGPPKEWSSGCTFLDYDRDGHLDLFVTSYQQFDPAKAPLPGKSSNCEWKGLPVFCGPRGLPFGTARLYRNRADGTFEEVTQKAGIRAASGYYAFTAVAADLNLDGWTDIYVACDSTPSLLFRNNGNGTFSEIATETGVAYSEHGFEQGGMGVAVGDIDNDGLLDLIKTNFAGDYPNVFRNIGGGIFEDVVLRAGMAVNPQYVGWGVALVDLDNDGWKDVFQVNGHVYPELDRHGRDESYRQPRLVYRNLAGGRFEDVSGMAGSGVGQKASSRGAAFGDIDNDGDIDVVVINMGERLSLLRNDTSSANHWLQLKLQGTKSNRSALGATVILEAGGVRQTGALVSQSSYISQNDLRLHFGLGSATRVDRMTVRWPSGMVEEFSGVPADGLFLLVEGSGTAKRLSMPR